MKKRQDIRMKPRQKQTIKQKLTSKTVVIAGISVILLGTLITIALNLGNIQDTFAAGKTYNSDGDGKWKGAFNWTKSNSPGRGGFPGKNDDATIDGNTIDVAQNQNVNNLSFKNSGTLNIKSGNKLNVHGTLDLKNGSVDASSGDLVLEQGAKIKNMSSSNFTGSYSKKDASGVVDSTVFRPSASYGSAKVAVHGFQDNNCDFSVTYKESNPNTASSITNSSTIITTNLKSISNNEYYQINRSGCTKNAKVTLFWDQNTPSKLNNLSSKSSLEIAHHNGNGWEDININNRSGKISGSGSITSKLQSNFSPFTYGSNSSSGPLPVELINFNVKVINGGARLEWATASETNNNHFKVQKRTGDSEFKTISKVEGYGTTTEQHEYEYTDNKPVKGKVYYRLKQVDHDGSYEYSNVKAVKGKEKTRQNEALSIEKVSPNPFRNGFNLEYKTNGDQNVKFTLRNMKGNVVSQSRVDANRGQNEFSYNQGSELPKGTYILTLRASSEQVTKKVMKR